jgi:hypothetical protein
MVPIEPTADDLRYIELMEQIGMADAQLNCVACVCLDVADGKVPRFEKDDRRWCHILDWVTRLGIHALGAPGKLRLHDDD